MKIMNKLSRILSIMLVLLTLSASWTGTMAQYAAVKGKGAHVGKIYYYIDEMAYTAIVTNKTMASTGSDEGTNSYSGAIIIPETFDLDGDTYTVTGIQDYAFIESTGLLSVVIPSTVTTIGTQVFDGCTQLKEITVMPGNQYFCAEKDVLFNLLQSELIFCAKTKTGKYTVPSDVEKIREFAFNGCEGLTEVVLPDGLKEIGEFAFTGCTAMESINIPASLTSLGNYAFRGASSLTSTINIPVSLSSISNNTFRECSQITKVIIPEGITSIGDNAFKDCASLASIELPKSLNTLGNSAFENSGLTSINIPSSITEITSSAFSGCKLTTISLSEGLRMISANAFSNNETNINEVRIPESVTSISNNAFNGTNVKDFYINNIPSKITIGKKTPFKITEDLTIHVFDKTLSYFENATNWSDYKKYFKDDTKITHVTSITLDNKSMTVHTTQEGKLNATINPEDARIKDVIYTSSNSNIVEITNPNTGEFQAGTEEGTAIITCTAADGSDQSAQCKVTVQKLFILATSVDLNKHEVSMEEEDQVKLFATVLPANATYKNITWNSSDTNVATVSETGLVTAVGPGVATITAISQDGAARAKCKISVIYNVLSLEDAVTYTKNVTLPVKELNYNREFTHDKWQPLYIPFRMSYEDWSDQFDVARLLNIHSYDTNNDGTIDKIQIEVAHVKDGTLKENHPYLIRAKVAGKKTITLYNTTIYPAEANSLQCASTEYTYDFNGVYQVTTGINTENSKGYLMKDGGFKKASNTAKINPYRFYMQITAKDGQLIDNINEAKIVVIDELGFEETTAINSVESDTTDATAIYSANGIKQASTKQGLNIVRMTDGSTKKIFVK